MSSSQQEEQLISLLSARLGPSGLKFASEDKARYLVEERGLYQGEALAVARPSKTEDVAFIVASCRGAGVPVIPQGGNTGLVGGQVPFGGLVLSLERMNAICEVDVLNGTMTVEAGCTLQKAQEAAARHESLFPLSLASEGTCQIGGNISSNAGGTAVLRYGNMRDLVLGLEVVMPDGRIWSALRGLRKDNSGYDLKQIFIGSEGTLGIITAAVLKLYPKLKSRMTAFAGLAGVRQAQELFGLVKSSCGDVLGAFEFMPRFGIEIVTKHMPGMKDPLLEPHAFYALIELSSVAEEAGLADRMESLLGQAFEAGLVEDATIGVSEAQNKALWALRENMSDAQKYEGGSIKHDVSVPVSRVAEFILRGTELCEALLPGLRVCAFGHMGDGNIHFNLSQPLGMDKQSYLQRWSEFNRIVHDLVVSMHGSIAAEHGVGFLKRDELSHYKDEVSLDLMRRIKRAIDPECLLNPGKLIRQGNI